MVLLEVGKFLARARLGLFIRLPAVRRRFLVLIRAHFCIKLVLLTILGQWVRAVHPFGALGSQRVCLLVDGIVPLESLVRDGFPGFQRGFDEVHVLQRELGHGLRRPHVLFEDLSWGEFSVVRLGARNVLRQCHRFRGILRQFRQIAGWLVLLELRCEENPLLVRQETPVLAALALGLDVSHGFIDRCVGDWFASFAVERLMLTLEQRVAGIGFLECQGTVVLRWHQAVVAQYDDLRCRCICRSIPIAASRNTRLCRFLRRPGIIGSHRWPLLHPALRGSLTAIVGTASGGGVFQRIKMRNRFGKVTAPWCYVEIRLLRGIAHRVEVIGKAVFVVLLADFHGHIPASAAGIVRICVQPLRLGVSGECSRLSGLVRVI